MLSDLERRGLQESMTELVSRDLSSVEFVQDYIQFRFDGPCLTTLTLPSVQVENETRTVETEGYRDMRLDWRERYEDYGD